MPVFDEKFWTLPQTLFWILTRDPAKIKAMPAESKNHLNDTLNADAFDIYRSDMAQNTIQEIKSAATNEKITTHGIKHGQSSSPTVIPAIDWHTSILKGNNNNFRLEHEGNTVWSNLLFETKTILKNWPSSEQVVEPKKRGRKKGDGTIDDTKMLLLMQDLIESGKARSVLNAAEQVVYEYDRALKEHEKATKIKRLQEKYRIFVKTKVSDKN